MNETNSAAARRYLSRVPGLKLHRALLCEARPRLWQTYMLNPWLKGEMAAVLCNA